MLLPCRAGTEASPDQIKQAHRRLVGFIILIWAARLMHFAASTRPISCWWGNSDNGQWLAAKCPVRKSYARDRVGEAVELLLFENALGLSLNAYGLILQDVTPIAWQISDFNLSAHGLVGQ